MSTVDFILWWHLVGLMPFLAVWAHTASISYPTPLQITRSGVVMFVCSPVAFLIVVGVAGLLAIIVRKPILDILLD